jgi:hypothetical protein
LVKAVSSVVLLFRHGDAGGGPGSYADFQAIADPSLSILENLELIVPAAVELGLLPPESDPKQMVVRSNGRLLNMRAELGGELGEITEARPIELLDARSRVRLHMRYKPDGGPQQARVIEASPVDPLGPQLSGFIAELRTYRWLRRRKKNMGFRLRKGVAYLDLDHSPAEQGLSTGVELRVEPRLAWGWPVPQRTLRAITLALLAVLIAVVAVYFVPPPSERWVRVTTTVTCFIAYRDKDGWQDSDSVVAGVPRIVVIPRAAAQVIVLPRLLPAFDLPPTRGVFLNRMSERADIDPKKLFGSRRTVQITIKGTKGVDINNGAEELNHLFINGFEAQRDMSGPGFYNFIAEVAENDLDNKIERGYRLEFKGYPQLQMDQAAYNQWTANETRPALIQEGFLRLLGPGPLTITIPYKERESSGK